MEMKMIGIMQPYFMPYVGYWQLVNLVDEYVIYDDVNYINRGWINRNKIFYSNAVRYINIPILNVSQNKKINELKMSDNLECYKRLMNIIRMAYKKAPYYGTVILLMEDIIMYQEKSAAKYLAHSLEAVANYLEIKTDFLYSSEIEKDELNKGEEKIIDICIKRRADYYINAIGGQNLYHKDRFAQEGIKLQFLQTIGEKVKYKQFGNEFYENLSMIDMLMFNSKHEIKDMLNQYRLI